MSNRDESFGEGMPANWCLWPRDTYFFTQDGINTFWLHDKSHYKVPDLAALMKIVPRGASYAWVDSENCPYEFFVGHGWSKI